MSKTVQTRSSQSNSYQNRSHTISGVPVVTRTNGENDLFATHLLQSDLLQQLDLELQQGVEMAVKHHKFLMGQLVENCFLTEKQIQHHHEFHLNLIKEAFSFSVSCIIFQKDGPLPEVEALVQEKLSGLTTTINSQLTSYIRKHEIVTDSLSGKVKDITNEADCLYEDLMEEHLDKIRKGENDKKNFNLKNLHNQCHQKAVTEFRKMILEIGLPDPNFWQIELEFKIHEKFQDYQLEFGQDVSPPSDDNDPTKFNTNHLAPVPKEEAVKTSSFEPFIKIHQNFSQEKPPILSQTTVPHEFRKNSVSTTTKPPNFTSVDEVVSAAFASAAAAAGRRRSSGTGQQQIPPTNQIKRSSIHQSSNISQKMEQSSHVTPKNASDHWRIAQKNFPPSAPSSSAAATNPARHGKIYDQKIHPVTAVTPLNLVVKTTAAPPPPLLQPLNNSMPRKSPEKEAIHADKKIPPAVSPGPPATHIINLGIHLEDSSIWVGVFRNSGEFQEIISAMDASIIFLPSGRILIGPEATKNSSQNSYFTLKTLLTSPATKAREIYCQQTRQSMHLCNEEVMAAFLVEIKRLVQTRLSTVLFNVVFSLSSLATSDQRERLRAAASLAGFRKSRIVSSFLSTAISLCLDEPQNGPPKYFCIAHYDISSFSATIAEIRHSSAILKAVYGTETIADKPGQDFLQGQQRLVNLQNQAQVVGGPVGRVEEGSVMESYEKILKMCKQRVGNLPIEDLLIVTGSNGSRQVLGPDKILLRLCGNKLKKLDVPAGPLKGASFLASILGSKTHPFRALEVSQFDLELTIGDTQPPHRYHEFQQVFSQRKVFSKNIYVTKGGSCALKLEQKFWNKNSSPVTDHQLTLKLPPQIHQNCKNEECIVTVDCHCDEDGVYGLTFHPHRLDVTVLRRDRYLLTLNSDANFLKFQNIFQNSNR